MATSRVDPTQRFAIKSIDLNSADDLMVPETEVKNYLCMDHPHIARLFDVYESKEHIHLVMECLEGGDLFDKMAGKRSCFNEDEASKMLSQLLSAVNYMHRNGVVHRDVKMENIVFDKHGCLKLIDFGLSGMLDPNSGDTLSRCCGTIEYCAPEVLKKQYTSQCDLWSVGVVAYILLCGRMPFYGSEGNQVRKIFQGSYSMSSTAWRNVSEDAKSFVRSLLEVDPCKRLTAAEALEHPWIFRSREQACEGMNDVVRSLFNFGQLSQLQQHCMQMCAWSLPNEDHARVRDYFTALDRGQKGVIKMSELKSFLKTFSADESSNAQSVEKDDCSQEQEMCYSEFLAAMLGNKIELNDKILTCAYRRFDLNGSRALTKMNLRDYFGCYDQCMDALFDKIDRSRNGYISLSDFIAFLVGASDDKDVIGNAKSKEMLTIFGARWPAFLAKFTLMLYA
jgi:calcium-dependent protein kinase